MSRVPPAAGAASAQLSPAVWSTRAITAESALDDDFTAAALDAKWSEWDVSGRLTASIDDSGALLQYDVDAASQSVAGLYQAVPGASRGAGTSWMVTAAVGAAGEPPVGWVIGLLLAGDLAGAPSTADAVVHGRSNLVGGGPAHTAATVWTSHAAFGSVIQQNDGPLEGCYRAIKIAGTVYYWYSETGEPGTWNLLDQDASLAGDPANVGVALSFDDSGRSISALVRSFKFAAISAAPATYAELWALAQTAHGGFQS